MPPIVALEKVSFIRQGKSILRDISWSVQQGEHWALLGANGSGKTTLLKILTGYAWATSGSVEVLGKRYGEYDLRELRKTIGWVSAALEGRIPGKDTALDVVLSGYDATLGVYRETTEAERGKAKAVLEGVNSLALLERTFGTLSQGEQQRILIARALINEPALLILDEPCAGLDPVAREDFLHDLGRLAADPKAPTLIMVSHHIEELGSWISQCLALREGGIEVCGPIDRAIRSEVLTRVFGRPCTVERSTGGYRMHLTQD